MQAVCEGLKNHGSKTFNDVVLSVIAGVSKQNIKVCENGKSHDSYQVPVFEATLSKTLRLCHERQHGTVETMQTEKGKKGEKVNGKA